MAVSSHSVELRLALVNPRQLCERLGLLEGSARQTGDALTIRCPLHQERSGSCSVTRGADGTVRFRCFGCQATGDALTLVAAAHGLDMRSSFKDVLLAAADIAGRQDIADEISGKAPRAVRALPPRPEPGPEREYPPIAEVAALWLEASLVSEEHAVKRVLEARALSASEVDRFGLAKALSSSVALPRWASYQGQSWRVRGYRMVLPMYSAAGELTSVRAWQTDGIEGPKRLPPAGHSAGGLVLANSGALRLLKSGGAPQRIVIAEGESDYLSGALRWPGTAVFGVVSGSWTADFAARIPFGSQVIVRTDNDAAGDKYAEQIIATVKTRATVWRKTA